MRRCVGALASGWLMLSGCERGALPKADSLPASEVCTTSKIAFSQTKGCLNDGSVEFCLPKGNPTAEATVMGIAPKVSSTTAAGRARCDLATEKLFLFPTSGEDAAICSAPHGALTDAAWATLCRIAALPDVREIVATFYE